MSRVRISSSAPRFPPHGPFWRSSLRLRAARWVPRPIWECSMKSRLLVLLTVTLAALGSALIALPPAHAEPIPPVDQDWAMCTDAADEYCVYVKRRNGANVNPGDTYQPYVDSIGTGTIRYGV